MISAPDAGLIVGRNPGRGDADTPRMISPPHDELIVRQEQAPQRPAWIPDDQRGSHRADLAA